jgi:hypothetical protein
MDNISQSANKVKDLYQDLSYFDQYGTSVFIFFILVTILFVIYSYTKVMTNIQPIKDDWVNQRCKPQVIPFAGLINTPPGMSKVDFTQKNFTNCMQDILISITGEAVKPLTYVTYLLQEAFNVIGEAINFVRQMLSKIRTTMTTIAQELMGRLANIMVPIQTIIIAFLDSMEKVKGIMTAGIYTSLGTYYALKALMGAIVQFIIIILLILAALIVVLWIIPFTWPVATTMTLVFISLAIPLAIIVVFMTQVLHVQTDMSIPGLPPKPSVCFDKNTMFNMNDGTKKSISVINVGDVLENNIIVTAKLRLNGEFSEMYNLHGTIVSGSHYVKHLDKWIFVRSHPDAKKLQEYKEDIIYCLNTTAKEIVLNGDTYKDWDDLFEDNVKTLLEKCVRNNKRDKTHKLSNIHRFFDGGFIGSTQITLLNGNNIDIKDVEIGHVLRNGEIVYGLVEIEGKKLSGQYVYNLGGNNIFCGGPNLNLSNKNLEKLNSTLDIDLYNKYSKDKIKKQDKLYHLLVDKGKFNVGEIQFYHYDSCVELFLDNI